MKITVVTPRYAISGVPLAQVRFARALAAQGHDVELIIGHVNAGYQVPDLPGVRVTVWDRPRVITMLAPLMRHLRERSPDVVFVAEDHLTATTLLAALLTRSRAKISGSSRVTPFDTYSDRVLSKRWILKQLMRVLMPRADALTCVSRDMVEQYRQVFPGAPHVCVYNIIDDGQAAARMREPVDDPWLNERDQPVVVAAGGLVPWKGFDDLLRAIALVREQRPVRLLLLGEGPMRASLEALAAELGIAEAVRMPGNVDNPLKYFSRSDVFALSSHVEGMPNALVEAMQCGCTAVAVNCPTGPRELLEDGRFGYLVPMRDPRALAGGILRALEHPIAPGALRTALEPFAAGAVIRRHFEALGLSTIERGA